jgi:outer membrane lipoprotein SlyB
MTRRHHRVWALAAALVTCAVTAQGPPPPPPPPPELGQAPTSGVARTPAQGDTCDRCGRIESILPVTAKDQWTPLGSVTPSPSSLGVAANGNPSTVTMVQIGPGFTNQGAVLIGAAGGAAYGTRPNDLNRQRWEVVVRMDAGGQRAVMQNYEPMLREGDHVRVMGTQLELVQ